MYYYPSLKADSLFSGQKHNLSVIDIGWQLWPFTVPKAAPLLSDFCFQP